MADRTRVAWLLGVFIVFFSLGLFLTFESFPGHEELRIFLVKELTRVEPLADDTFRAKTRSENIIYILGGWQGSLKNKFRVAADLYKKEEICKIMVMSQSGITEYNPSLGRNMTNDEWTIKNLVSLGIKKEDIEIVFLKEGFFGTLSEAKGIADIASRRGYRHLVLVTSHYHTLRTWKTFSKIMGRKGMIIHIYASDESVGLHNVLLEYIKLKCYESVLLPAYT